MSLLAISPKEATFGVRGFHGGTAQARHALERHGTSFVSGYNAALKARDLDTLACELDSLPKSEVGFAYEGAAMACALLDLLIPGRRGRLASLLRGPGDPHVYMVHVGAGWALARLRLRPRHRLRALDPFLRWLALDGYGFHEAFFHTRSTIRGHHVPRRLTGYECRAFDQGVGRALWFVGAGDVGQATSMLRGFSGYRQPDLWSGLALAASYTTSATEEDLRRLLVAGRAHAPEISQGAAFAVAARHRAGNVLEETRTAAAVLCGQCVEDVVATVREARRGLLADPAGQSYERWRTAIGERLPVPRGPVAA